jgi:NAD(P)-dependent dehydrogenase (short-subunit alcohol dehydrogenase family)/NTP pyrophosphatase (non-canonical NTP hydrolase)
MDIDNRTVLVLGGPGLVGMAVCRELLTREPREIRIHSLRAEESERARAELDHERRDCVLSTSGGDIFALAEPASRSEAIRAQLHQLRQEHLDRFLLYRLLAELRPDIVVDCVNTATAIAYRDMYRSAEALWEQVVDGDVEPRVAENLLEALYVPRLIRHMQVLYRGMIDAGTHVYVKVGTSGTGGMGLNVPYTHSEEKPSRTLLSKSAVAGAHSMLLFLMARTPGAPITKEIKPAAAIAWKRIDHGPIYRRGEPVRLCAASPRPLGRTFSTFDEAAAEETDEVLEAVYIDTGENGIFSLEEFALLTTAAQMEFVTPEEIASYLVFEIEGGNTGHDIIGSLDNAVMGPTYRAGVLRSWAMSRMRDLQDAHGTRSVAFEMLGPPRNSKLLFEAHLLRQAFETMAAVRNAEAAEVRDALDALVRDQPRLANEVVSIGIPILTDRGEIIRGPRVLIPSEAADEEVTPDLLETWIDAGWVDLRLENCALWKRRFQAIQEEIAKIPEGESSSRYLRNRTFWEADLRIQPGKLVGWILSVEEHGDRFKR